MSVRFTRWTIPLLLALGAWAGFTRVSAEPGGTPEESTPSAPDSKPVEPASLDPGTEDGATEDGATEDTLSLGGDPIESSRLLPISGFS